MNVLNDKDLKNYLEGFDILKYPKEVYEELVFTGKHDDNKYTILGAWKTGCLRLVKEGKFYRDNAGKNYAVTNRWKENCPVGYDTWHYITKNRDEIERALPSKLEKETPDVIKSLIDRKGFGFIWAVFAAHCIKPETYPLYDQHVYRTYIYLQSNGSKAPNTAPNKWSEYLNYCAFFNAQLSQTDLNQADCDRALWSFGKMIKLNKGPKIDQKIEKKTAATLYDEEEFVHSQTLFKLNSFWWGLDGNFNLSISREFHMHSGSLMNVKTFSKDDLNALFNYLKRFEIFYLRNNVEKLKNGTEKEDGIGYFLFNKLKFTTTNSQLASQLAAIFTYSGVWKKGTNRKPLTFTHKNDDQWQSLVELHYQQSIEED
jgi:hypothetical protein